MHLKCVVLDQRFGVFCMAREEKLGSAEQENGNEICIGRH